MFALLDIRAWLAIACAALVLLCAGQQVRVSHAKAATAEARTELANLKTTYAQAAQKAEADARAEETRREAEKQEIVDAARKQSEDAIAAVSRADAAADGLRGQLAKYSAAIRAATNPGAGKGGPPAAASLDLLVGVLQRSDEATGELARFADDSRIAGLACERSYDALTGVPK
jgi:ABC-type Na+ efflux pump permease subunit